MKCKLVKYSNQKNFYVFLEFVFYILLNFEIKVIVFINYYPG